MVKSYNGFPPLTDVPLHLLVELISACTDITFIVSIYHNMKLPIQ